jgi:hypothetical protein
MTRHGWLASLGGDDLIYLAFVVGAMVGVFLVVAMETAKGWTRGD